MAPNRVMLSVAGLPTLYRLVPADSRHSFAAQALVSDHYYPVAELLIQPGCDHTPPPSNERCPRLALKPWVPCRFLKWLSHQACPEVASPLDHKRFAILGLGSSCYPRFCAAADMFESMMLAAGAPLSWTQLHVAAGCCTLAVFTLFGLHWQALLLFLLHGLCPAASPGSCTQTASSQLRPAAGMSEGVFLAFLAVDT